jgi:hypothetical protein
MKKGQIFSLDFLISLVAVTAAVGLLIQTTEVNLYYQKETMRSRDIKAVAETVADLLVASNDITCEDSDGVHLMNCLAPDVRQDQIRALIPEGYRYKIGGLDTDISTGNLGDRDYYEVERRIIQPVAPAEPVPELTLTEGYISVKVWKQDED